MKHVLLFASTIIFLISCSDKDKHAESTLGTISFAPYGEKIAQAPFLQGLLLMHNFEYDDAQTSFLEAQKLDSNFHMAYWGEAMTYNHPLWHSQYTDEARAALNKLAPTPEERVALATTEIEKDLIQSANILYADGDDKLARDKDYSAFMEKLYRKYEGNHEVAAFYALSILAASPDRETEAYGKGAVIALRILKENPQHPGALHYLIHAYDDPDHAHMALDAANDYSVVAKDAGHALHMPSHIYVALGMWDEVVSSNIASFAASNDRRIRLDLDNNARDYHALQWLMYGHLQRNELREANRLLTDMKGYHDELSSPRARAYLTMMRAAYLIDSREWDSEAVRYEIDDSELNVSIRAVNNFVAGMSAYQNKDAETLQAKISEMQSAREIEYKKMMQRGAATCSGVNWTSQLPTETDINNAHVMEMQLKAVYAILNDDTEQAESWLSSAAELEDNTTYSFGPPTVVKPAHEFYGEWLFAMNRPEEGVVQFTKALEKAPGRRLSVEALRVGGDSKPSI
jgi:hypothetical protein